MPKTRNREQLPLLPLIKALFLVIFLPLFTMAEVNRAEGQI